MGSLGLTSGFEPSEWLDPGELAGDWPHERNLAMFQFADHRCFVDTFDGLVRAPGVEVVLDATVLKLRTDPATGAVATAAVSSLDGNRFSVAADRFVLACGGIDNARLLLASQDRNPAGLGNDHDLVGRYFMDHLSIDSGFVRPATRDLPWVELFGERRDERGSKFQAMYWHGEELLRERGLLNAAFWINFEAGSSASPGVLSLRALHGGRLTQPAIAGRARHASQVVLHPIPVSRFTLARVANRYPPPRILAFRIMAEQAPNPDSRITLSGARDRLGVPLARLDWRLSDVDLWSIRQHQDALDEAMQAAGIGKMFGKFGDEQPRATLVSNYHHMGTTRMHPDPRRGVVATDSRVHGVPNLFVAGSSVFPTGGYLNPTLTIIALAMRLAACIRRESGALVLA
ncbi:MAG: GMC oxidoreductase, partial [Hyphomicrobiales bacterium]